MSEQETQVHKPEEAKLTNWEKARSACVTLANVVQTSRQLYVEPAEQVDYIGSLVMSTIKDFGGIHFEDLTMQQLIDIGCQRWSDDSELMLLPIWTYSFLPESFIGGYINQEEYEPETILTSEVSNDFRFGCLVCGVYPKAEQAKE